MSHGGIAGRAGLVVGVGLRVLLETEGVEAEVPGAVNGAVAKLEKEGNLEQANEPQNLIVKQTNTSYLKMANR